MKSFIFSVLTLCFLSTSMHATISSDSAAPSLHIKAANGGDVSDIKVVVSQKRIWLVADEMPMKCLKTQVKNAQGEVVIEKCFSSKVAEWNLNIENLPKGEYTLILGQDRVEKFRK